MQTTVICCDSEDAGQSALAKTDLARKDSVVLREIRIARSTYRHCCIHGLIKVYHQWDKVRRRSPAAVQLPIVALGKSLRPRRQGALEAFQDTLSTAKHSTSASKRCQSLRTLAEQKQMQASGCLSHKGGALLCFWCHDDTAGRGKHREQCCLRLHLTCTHSVGSFLCVG